jgi:hypothetical protein
MKQTFKEYIQEAITKEKAQELFGKELFGELRNKTERDTDFEKDVLNQIKKFVSSNKPTHELYSFLKILRDSKVHFPDILKPDAKIVYRGSGIPHEEIPDYSKLKPQLKNKTSVYIINNFTYYPKGEIQSFTKKFKIAADQFSMSTHIRNTPIIYEVQVDDDFVMSSELMNIINKNVALNKEYEILHVSNKPLKCKLYILNPDI